MDGSGSVNWWGFSPALNLEQCVNPEKSAEMADSLNILLVGSGDLRHILTTLSFTSTPIHFFMLESCLEVYARHMLFLKLLSESSEQLGMQERVELFLELYGNSLLRAQTADYLTHATPSLIKMVTDPDYQQAHFPVLDLSALKFKERDFLEGIFKFWKNSHPFPIEELWDKRLRSYLGTRYDSKQGVFDWDYHMKLHDKAPLVDCREYKEWRESGVAFRLRGDAPYRAPNRTLASGLLFKEQGGERVARRGYWGDIVNSPYLSFGISTNHKEFLRTEGGKHIKTSVQVSERTLSDLICSISGRCDESESHHAGTTKFFNGSYKITFLPLQSIKEMAKKARFNKLFDIAYFSNSMVHNLVSGIEAILAPHSVLVLESAKFILDLKEEKIKEYEAKVTKMASALNYQTLEKEENRHHLIFIR